MLKQKKNNEQNADDNFFSQPIAKPNVGCSCSSSVNDFCVESVSQKEEQIRKQRFYDYLKYHPELDEWEQAVVLSCLSGLLRAVAVVLFGVWLLREVWRHYH